MTIKTSTKRALIAILILTASFIVYKIEASVNSNGINSVSAKSPVYPSVEMDIINITPDQMRSDIITLDKVLMESSTDALRYEKEYRNFYQSRFDNLPGYITPNLLTLYDIVKKSPVPKSTHTSYYSPLDVVAKVNIGTGFSFSQLNDPVNIKKNKDLIKLLGLEPVKEGTKDFNLFSNTETQASEPETRIIEEGKTAYLKFPSFVLGSGYNKILSDFAKEIKDYKYLIVDVRGNLGGYADPWKIFLQYFIDGNHEIATYYGFRDSDISKRVYEELAGTDVVRRLSMFPDLKTEKVDKLPDSMTQTDDTELSKLKYFLKFTDKIDYQPQYPFKGKIFLLTNYKSFSSSDMFAQYMKKSKTATLVGSNTSGGGNITGDYYHAMPYSGFIFRVEVAYCFNEDGSSNSRWGTEPDIKAPTGLELDYVLNNLIKD
ncbi:MAG: S41 family peptidase [Clostridiaceae bacterium]